MRLRRLGAVRAFARLLVGVERDAMIVKVLFPHVDETSFPTKVRIR